MIIKFSLLALCLFLPVLPATAEDALQVMEPCPKGLRSRPPRGIACLHCNQPEARAQADKLVEILRSSCLKQVAINYLVDGTFGYSPETMRSHIDLLSENGRELYITFYLTNGPAQRRAAEVTFKGFGAGIAPEEFRQRIVDDADFRNQYQELVKRLLPVLEHAAKHSAKIQIIPMLEDNLSDKSFSSMLEITRAAVPPALAVRFGRNPCPDCYAENGSEPGGASFIEQHTASDVRIWSGIVSNDGNDVEGNYQKLSPIMRVSAKRKNQFIVWTAKFQGLGPSGELIAVAERKFEMPSDKERSELIKLLTQ